MVAVFMALALVGLVIMQVNWIRHDLEIREERFAQQVSEALSKAVGKLETRESVRIISKNIPWAFEDSVVHYFEDFPEPAEPPEFPEPPEEITLDSAFLNENMNISFQDSVESNISIVSRSGKGEEKVIVSVNSDKKHAAKAFAEMQKTRQEAVNTYKKQKVQAQIDMEKARIQMKKISKVMSKMAVEYERKDIQLLERINPELIDSLVGFEFKNIGITLPYSISLLGGQKDSVIWKREIPQADSHALNEYKTNLFPGDIVNRKDVVKVGFPQTLGFFLSSIWLMLVSSALFTLAIVCLFSYTLYIILRQKKLSEIRNDFINNMTHEFKTPIATIRLASDAINNPEVISDKEKIKFYTSIIKDENDRMNSHVENILQMALFDRKLFAPDLTSVNMHDVIADAISKISLQVEQRRGCINFHPNAENSTVQADARFIPVVIMNLLDNAVKYCESDPVIEIETKNSGKNLIISVQDNGIGMSKEMQKRIFEKFYRVPSGNLHNVKGFGLGLSYVKAIVSAHHGSIHVTSAPGKGSRFEILLPLSLENNG